MKKEKLDKIVLDSIVCKSQLLETSNSLRKKADEVYRAEEELSNIKEKISHIEKIENRNRELLREVSKLKQEVGNGGKDSKLADEIERLKKIIEERDRKIEAMKEKDKMEELEYYKITKDQFQQIEKILKEYKEKIDVLERENSRLKLATNSNIDNNILDKINSSFIKFSDVTSSSFFKDNYVKISKA
jgi:DNA repair exonuclease SbcCD ATPase subunit